MIAHCLSRNFDSLELSLEVAVVVFRAIMKVGRRRKRLQTVGGEQAAKVILGPEMRKMEGTG